MSRNNLTVTFQGTRRQRSRTFTNVTYDVTWNRLTVALPDGSHRQYDRIGIVDMQASVPAHQHA